MKSRTTEFFSGEAIRAALRSAARENGPDKVRVLQSFFKTGKGQYGEGDVFLGVTVPQVRALVKANRVAFSGDAVLPVLHDLLGEPYHECRLFALLALVEMMKRADSVRSEALYRFYMAHVAGINNWDLVDLSAPQVVGAYLLKVGNWDDLATYARSGCLWVQRIAIVATFAFIKDGQTAPTYEISDILLTHPHDLIQKAVGWMLREAGKRVSLQEECRYLATAFEVGGDLRCRIMPRTMLRYAIERFPEDLRRRFLSGEVAGL